MAFAQFGSFVEKNIDRRQGEGVSLQSAESLPPKSLYYKKYEIIRLVFVVLP